MKTLVISKPIYDYILPLVEFPSDGDKFNIEKTVNTISSYGSMVALTLGKYGVDIDFTGAVGDDETAKKIRNIFDSYQVKTQYLETCFTEKSAVSYKIYNKKSNKFTSISELSNKLYLTKYKYEFIPEAIIMDDKDYNANLAAINNYPNANLIFIADKFTKESSIYCNKCKYIISSLSFAMGATGISDNLNKSKNLVALFQKFIDLYSANLIIKLDNFDMLYCINDEVRLIKNINKSIINKESIYYGVLVYFLINKYNVEDAIKLTNKVMLSSKNEINLVDDIPDYSVLEQTINEFNLINEKNKQEEQLNLQNNIEQSKTIIDNQSNSEVNLNNNSNATVLNTQQNVHNSNIEVLEQNMQVQNQNIDNNTNSNVSNLEQNNMLNENNNGVNNGQNI